MKQILTLVVLAVALLTGTATAQTSMATLEHEGELTVYNGTGAFAQAMEAASDGDAIYLGPGRYNAANITKPVTIKGAGYIDEKDNGLYGTYLNGDMNIELPEGKGVNIEGIYFTNRLYLKSALNSSVFLNCGFDDLFFDATTENLTMKDCRVYDYMCFNASQKNMLCQNSAFGKFGDYSDGKSTMYYKNCTLWDMRYGKALKIATIENSIVTYYCSKSSGINWINTLICNSNGIPDFSQLENCWSISYIDLQKIWDGDWWELTDEAAAKYIGTDGKQVGMYGGSRPFTKTVSGPRITKMVVPAETDENGKISVTITVDRNE